MAEDRSAATVTHGRHCPCSACAREDWTKIDAPCGMHGAGCPAVYGPLAGRLPDAASNATLATNAATRDPFDVLRECRQANWNRYYDLPGRDVPDVVLHIDQALGQPSRWLARFKERFPNQWTDELEEALNADA